MQNDDLVSAFKSISNDLIKRQNQSVDEICTGIEFFELSELQEGFDTMMLKLAKHGNANKLYKQWKVHKDWGNFLTN
jgi:hypothetical protein